MIPPKPTHEILATLPHNTVVEHWTWNRTSDTFTTCAASVLKFIYFGMGDKIAKDKQNGKYFMYCGKNV
jgi:hypothetical protein